MKLDDKIDKMIDDIGEIKVTMAVNTESLKEHIKRTNILERRVEPLWMTYKVVVYILGSSLTIAALLEIYNFFKGR